MKSLVTLISPLLLLLALPSSGQAQLIDTTEDFTVTIEIEAQCTILSVDDLDFGSTGFLTEEVEGTTDIEIQCTSGTVYNILLDEGDNSADPAARQMENAAGTEDVEYSLYRNAGHTLVWGDTVGSNTYTATSAGEVETIPIYGLVPVQDTPPTGTYTDTVTATITF